MATLEPSNRVSSRSTTADPSGPVTPAALVGQHDTGYWVMLAARAFARVAEQRLRPLGIGVAHVPLLLALAQEGSLTVRHFDERARVEQPTATALVQRMGAAGLVERTPDPSDRRSVRISLSSDASNWLPEALRLRSDAVAAATGSLSVEEVHLLDDLLRRVLHALDAAVANGPGHSPP